MDTAIFIYFMERHPDYVGPLRELFQQASTGERRLVTSAITLFEVLVVPMREKNIRLITGYLDLLRSGKALRVVPLSRRVLFRAAMVRAQTGARTPDAIQIAAGLEHGCASLLTNDRTLRAPEGIRVVQLRDCVPA